MEKKLILFFTAILLISVSGFFNSYIRHINQFSWIVHLHFTCFFSWLILLIIQPYLIQQGRISLHKRVGKFSYFLAPLLVLSIGLMLKLQIEREPSNAAFSLCIGLLYVVSFSAYYVAAMINSKNLTRHVGFMLVCSLIVLNPGMARLFNLIQPDLGLLASIILPYLVCPAINIYQKIKLQKSFWNSPYALFLFTWTLEIVILFTLPSSSFWQNFVHSYVVK